MALRTIFRIQIVLTATLVTAASKGENSPWRLEIGQCFFVVRGGHCPNVTVSKKINAPYRSGPSKSWIKIKNPNAAAAMRIIDGTF